MTRRLALALGFALLTAVGAFFVVHGRFNIDEGMHLHAGRLIYEQGRLPYRDFPFSQGPAGPFLYGAAGALFGSSLLVGRCVSLALNLVGVAALARVAALFSGLPGALLVVGFTLVNFPALWTFSQVRTEPPAIALAGLAVLAWFQRRGSALRWALAPALLVWATAFRLTYGLPLLVTCALTAHELRRSPRLLAWVAVLVLANGLLAAWPLLVAPDQSLFHVVTSQLDRAERLGWSHLPFSARFWFFAMSDRGFWPILLASGLPVLYVALRWREGFRPRGLRGEDPALAVLALFGMAVGSFAPTLLFRSGFFQYFVNASLLLVTAVAIALPLLVRRGGQVRRASVAVASCAGIAGAWLAIAHVDTFLDPGEPTVWRLRGLRERVAEIAPAGCTMLTFETQLAVELGCHVTRGLEYSYFSFFRELPDAEARERGVLNRQLLLRELRTTPPEFVALSREDVERITGKKAPAGRPPRLPGMSGRYVPMARLELPVLVLLTSHAELYVYARADLGPGT